MTNQHNRILIVDDDKITGEQLTVILSSKGYTVECAVSAEKAIEKIKNWPVDLFLIDLRMPGMSGLELLKKLDIKNNTYEAIMITAFEGLDSAKEAMQYGAFSYASKPIKYKDLAPLMKKALEMAALKKMKLDNTNDLEEKVRSRTKELEREIDERKKAEEALKDSEQKWASLTQNTKDILLIVDKKGTIQYINKTFPPYTLEKTIGTDVYKYLPKEQHNIMSESLKKVFRTGKSDSFEVSSDIPEIGIIWFNTRVVPIKTEGKTSSAILITSDITDRKKAEEMLIKSEESYKELANSIDDIFFAFDKELRYTYWNKASEKLTGISAKDAIGKTIIEIFPNNEETRKSIEVYKKVLKNRRSKSFINEYHFGGKKYFFEISAYPSGAGLSVFVKDITERKKIEKKLKESEEKLSTIIQKSPIPTAVGGSEGSIICFNEALEKLIGYKQSEKKDIKNWTKKLYPDKKYRDFVERNIKQALAGQKQDCTEFTITCKDGSKKIVDFHTSFFKDGLIIQMIDITERKLAEEKLAERLKSETLLSELSAKFVNIPASKVDDEIGIALKRVTEFIGVGRSVIIQSSPDGKDFQFTHSYNTEEVKPISKNINIKEQFSWIAEKLFKEEIFKFSNLDELPRQAHLLKQYYEQEDIRSAIAIPLAVGGSIMDSLSISMFHTERIWSEELIKQLRFFGEIIANALMRKKAEEALANERKYLKIQNDVSNALNTNASLNDTTDIILQGLNLHGADIGLLEKDHRLYIRGASTDLSKVFANTARSLFFDFNSNATARNYFDSLDETKTLSINELFNLISDKGSLSSKIIKTLISELSKASVGETIITPLKNSVGDRIGAVLLTKKPDQIFNMQERALVDSLCGTLALAIDKIIGEQKLQESEERYRLLLESISDSVYVLDREWRHVIVNDAATDFVRMPKEKLIGGKLTELFPGVEETPFFKVFKKVMKTRKPDIVTNEYEFEDGRKNYYEVHVYPVPEGILCISRDVTERRKALEALMDRQELLSNTFESMSDGVLVLDKNFHYTYWNHAMEKISKTPKEKVVSNPKLPWEIFPHLKEAGIDKMMKHAMKGEYAHRENVPYQLKDGTSGFTTEIFLPLKNATGEITGVVGVVHDITEQKLAEDKIRESEEKYRTSFDNSRDAITVFNKDKRIIDVNKSLIQLSGYSEDKLLSMELRDLFPEAASPQSAERIHTLLKGKEIPVFETYVLTKKGKKIPVDIGVTLLKNCYGEEFVFQGNIREITERKIAEEELKIERDRAQKYLDIAGTMFVAINTEGIVTLINKKGCKILGYEEDKIVGKNWFENFLPERIKKEVLSVSHKLLSGEIEPAEYYENPILTKKGEERLVAWHNTVIKDENDNIIGHLSSGEDITENKQADEAIKQERNQLINILDSLEDGIYIVNQQHDIQYVNPVLQKEFGPPDGKKCYQYFHDITKPCSWCKNKKVFAGETVRWEWESKKNNKIYDLVDTPIKNPDGSISKLEIFHDITGRKQYELKINESRERLNSIFEHVQTGIVIIDEETHEITDLNPTAERIIGIKKEKAVGRSCHKFICPAEKGKCPISDLGQTIDNSERVLLGISGNEVPILKTVVPMVLDGRRYLVVSFVDLTEKKRAEAELKESEEKYRMIFDSANDIIAQVDKTGKILNVNDKVEEILGYEPEEIIGKNFARLAALKLADIPGLLKILKDLIAGKKDLKLLEVNTLHKDGRNVSLEINTEVIKKNGKFVSLLSIIRDITERKRVEKEKEELELQLRQTEKMESIGQLAGGIAHDFNNQLGSIVGFADLIREMVMDDAKLSHYADNILITARRSAGITRQLLAFARKGKYKSVKVDIHKTIYEVVSLLKHSIHKKIVIRQHLNANPSTTSGDPSQLQNAILNIAINARDVMPKGGDLVFATDTVYLDNEHVKTHQYVSPPGNYLQLCISDTGSGMDKETQQHIFEPFFTTKEVGKGTGMGLAAVYGTINNHKGAIDVYSEPGRGTTFKIYLPLTTEGIGDETGFVKEADVIKGSAHILLADDEEMLGEMAKDMIETLGYKITICRNGKEAMKIYEKSWKDINLVILDMVMPEMDGKETYLEMKKVNPAIKVLLSSGYSITGVARELLSRGVDDFIQKPYRKAELSQKIAKVLNSD